MHVCVCVCNKLKEDKCLHYKSAYYCRAGITLKI